MNGFLCMAIAINGLSWRQQTHNGGFGKPKHIAEILYAAVTSEQAFL